MSEAPTPAEVVSALHEHPILDDLVDVVRRAAVQASERRNQSFASRTIAGHEQHLPALPDGMTLTDFDTKFGNPVSIIGQGVATPTEARLLGTLLALSAREEAPSEAEEQDFIAHVTWLAAHTPCDALLSLEAAAGEREELWRAVARIAVEPAEAAPDFGRTEALLAAAAIGCAEAPAAASPRTRALVRVKDPAVRALLAVGGIAREPLQGELLPTPLGSVWTAVLALTTILGVYRLARLVLKLAFGYARPAAFTLTERGLELTYRVELLGKVLRERTQLVPLANLSSLTREVPYPRAGLYAGLAALVLGTYFGSGLFIDALSGASGQLALMAATVIVAGLAIDFVLSSGLDGVSGRCRLLVEPRKGRAIYLGAIDSALADAMLASVTAVASGAHGPSLFPPPPVS
jgi:hypothetical protein